MITRSPLSPLLPPRRHGHEVRDLLGDDIRALAALFVKPMTTVDAHHLAAFALVRNGDQLDRSVVLNASGQAKSKNNTESTLNGASVAARLL